MNGEIAWIKKYFTLHIKSEYKNNEILTVQIEIIKDNYTRIKDESLKNKYIDTAGKRIQRYIKELKVRI